MKNELRNALINWKNGSTFGETRKVRLMDLPISDGTKEYVIELSISVKIRVGHLHETISEMTHVYTQAQSSSALSNPNGDIALFEVFAKTLNDNFVDSYNKAGDKLFQQISPDGFLDL